MRIGLKNEKHDHYIKQKQYQECTLIIILAGGMMQTSFTMLAIDVHKVK